MKAGAIAVVLTLLLSTSAPIVLALSVGDDAGFSGITANDEISFALSPPKADANATGPPTSLSAAVDGEDIRLTWTAPSLGEGETLTAYNVYRRTSSTSFSDIGTPTAESFLDTTVQRGVGYTYYVTALNGTAESDPSNEDSATVPAMVPGAPTLNAPSAGDGQVVLTWTTPSDNGGSPITNYNIYRGISSGGETFLTTVNNVLTYTDSTVNNGQTYYYRVSAVNSVDEGPLSNERSATPTGLEPPGAPVLNSATPGDGQVALSWTAPGDTGSSALKNYKIYRNGGLIHTTANTLTTYTDDSASNGVTYSYTVTAVNNDDLESDPSNSISATPTASTTVPGAPTLNAPSAGDGQVVLTWTAPSDNGGSAITNYNIYRGVSSNGEIFLVTLSNVLTYTDTGLTNGQTYYYKVSAVNGVGEGPLSNERSVTPMLITVPSAPTLNTATASGGGVVLTWTSPSSTGGSSITGYRVYRGTTSEGESFLTAIGTVLTYTDTDVVGGQAYYYKVSAVNGVGEGALSNEKSVTLITTPSMPEGLTLEPMNGDVSISWTAPTNNGGSTITGYRVYRGATEADLTQIGTTSGSFFTDTTTVKGSTYYYAVTAVNEAGEGARSEVSNITVPLSSVPSAPLELAASVKNGKIVLTWSPPESTGGATIMGYKVYRGTSDATLSILATVTKTTYEDGGIRDGVKYYYEVVAVNEAGDGSPTQVIEVTAPEATVVDSPLGLVAIAGLAVAGVAAVLYLLRRSRTGQ